MDSHPEWFLIGGGAAILVMLLESSLEAGLTAVNRARIRQMADAGLRRAQRLDLLLEERSRLLTVLSSLRTLSALLGGFLMCQGMGTFEDPVLLLATVLALMGAVLFIELLLRRLAATRAERFTVPLTPVLALLQAVTNPIMLAFQRLSRPFERWGLTSAGGKTQDGGPTQEDIRLMVEEGTDIEESEKEMIHSVLQFGDTIAREIMVPRVDMVCVEGKTPIARVLDIAVASGHSRIPVYEDTIDHILGIAYTRDLLTLLRDRQMDKPLRDCIRPAFIVHGTKKVDDLLRELQREKITIAIVVDEYGGTDGLLTMEDLIEEIVGEISDEYDKEIPSVEKMDDGSIVVDAKMIIEDVNEVLDSSVPSDDYETIGGYVYGHLGRVPNQGERFEVDGLAITVEKVQRQRIMKIRLQKTALESQAEHA